MHDLKKIIIGLLLVAAITTGLYMSLATPIRPASKPLPAAKPPLLIRGSVPYWDQQTATQSFAEHVSEVNQVALFWYYIDAQGKITKYQYAQEDPSILALAHKNHRKAFFTLTNLGEQPGDDWDSSRVEKVIGDQASRTVHVKDILTVFDRLPFDGMTIDYEQVDPSQRANFTAFINQLATSLHQRHKLLNVALHPVTSSDTEQRYYFQDAKALSQSADYLTVMTYDEHENDSDPGPIASYTWVTTAIDYLKTQRLDMRKIFLGVPVYGYDWTEGSDSPAADLTYQDSQKLLAKFNAQLQWDSTAKSPYFTYVDHGRTHEVWFEDSRSVAQKLKLAQASGLGGVSFWRLGEEDPGIWPVIKQLQ